MPGFVPPGPSDSATPSRPPFDEEYFEWVDLFDAVADGAGQFVMAEIGAGYGRWLVRGAAVARLQGRRFQGIAVEAEPTHFRWLRQHCRDNGVGVDDLDLTWAAIDAEPGFVPFSVGRSNSWYGQGVRFGSRKAFPDVRSRSRLKARSALGRPPADDGEGDGTIWIPRMTLSDLLAPYPRVDLLDIDVQGLESSILQSAIYDLDRRVRRLHVATHSHAVERSVRVLLRRHDWLSVYDYPSHGRSATPYGDIDFADGVQTWINPRVDATHVESAPERVDDRSMEHARVKDRTSPVALLETRLATLERQIARVRRENSSLKAKLADARRKLESLRAARDRETS